MKRLIISLVIIGIATVLSRPQPKQLIQHEVNQQAVPQISEPIAEQTPIQTVESTESAENTNPVPQAEPEPEPIQPVPTKPAQTSQVEVTP